MSTKKVVLLLIVDKDEKFLIFKRSGDETTNAGKYGLIGGGVEAKESLKTALKREVMEETSVDISDFNFLMKHVYRGTQLYIYYTDKYNTKKIKLNNEHSSFRWVSFDEAKNIDNLIPTNKIFMKKYLDKYGKKEIDEALGRIRQLISF